MQSQVLYSDEYYDSLLTISLAGQVHFTDPKEEGEWDKSI